MCGSWGNLHWLPSLNSLPHGVAVGRLFIGYRVQLCGSGEASHWLPSVAVWRWGGSSLAAEWAAVWQWGGSSLATERGRVALGEPLYWLLSGGCVAVGRLLIGCGEAVGFFEATPEVSDSCCRA